jgi:hypothetical protein
VSGSELVLAYCEPPHVRLTFTGAASHLEAVNPTSLYLTVDGSGLERGEYVFQVAEVDATGRVRLVPAGDPITEGPPHPETDRPAPGTAELAASVELPPGLELTDVQPALLRLVLQ